MERDQIREKLKAQKLFLKQRYHVKKMGIFGSIARNEANKKSDVDVLVEFNEPIGMFEFMRLEYFLKKILKRKVDLVTKKALKRVIKKDILKETIYV